MWTSCARYAHSVEDFCQLKDALKVVGAEQRIHGSFHGSHERMMAVKESEGRPGLSC